MIFITSAYDIESADTIAYGVYRGVLVELSL